MVRPLPAKPSPNAHWETTLLPAVIVAVKEVSWFNGVGPLLAATSPVMGTPSTPMRTWSGVGSAKP